MSNKSMARNTVQSYASHEVYGTGRLDGQETINGLTFTRVRYKNGLVLIPFGKVRHVLKASMRPLFLSTISPVACTNRRQGMTRITIARNRTHVNDRLPDVHTPTRIQPREIVGTYKVPSRPVPY